MIPIHQLEMLGLDFKFGDDEWSQALEWAYLCTVELDATLSEAMKLLTKDSGPRDENGRMWVPDKLCGYSH